MDWTIWLLFVLTEGALSAAPGPAVLLVVSRGLEGRQRAALWSATGILAANAFYFSISATSVGALLIASERLFTVVRWAGAGYLAYLGAKALFGRRAAASIACGARESEGKASARRWFFRAAALQISNPKALLFFVAILPQFVDRSGSIALQIIVLGITSILLELAILSTYGVAAARAGRLLMRPRLATATHRLSGLLLVGAAFGLARIGR